MTDITPPPGRCDLRRNSTTGEGGWAHWMPLRSDTDRLTGRGPPGQNRQTGDHGGAGSSEGHGGTGSSGGHGGAGSSGGLGPLGPATTAGALLPPPPQKNPWSS